MAVAFSRQAKIFFRIFEHFVAFCKKCDCSLIPAFNINLNVLKGDKNDFLHILTPLENFRFQGVSSLINFDTSHDLNSIVWFGFGALRSVYCNTRSNQTGTHCLKHPCLKWDSNPQTTVPNGSALPFGHRPAKRDRTFCPINLAVQKTCECCRS